MQSRRRLMIQDISSRSALGSELSPKLRVWEEHCEALGRAGFVSVGTPISEDFFILS